MVKLSVDEFRAIAAKACLDAGASMVMATSLVSATLSAEQFGRREVGIMHLPDYLASLRAGRIVGQAQPQFQYPLPAFIVADAMGGIAQLGFDLAFGDLVKRAKTFGIAVFSQRNSYTAGELGYYVRRLAQSGLIGMAAANAHAMMAVAPGAKAVYATNPLAFGVPLQSGMNPLVIDQASSATAFVNIARAAKEKRALPKGWAIDVAGLPTTDPGDAVLGALLPFGGYKGGNIALMVEMLSAGLSGAAWSLDAGNFQSGSDRPDIGLSVIAIFPAATETFAERATEQCNRLTEKGVFVPGIAQTPDFNGSTIIDVDNELLEKIREA